jgi:alkylation response protein AidB-like acyl-CoA dehydrogenase
MSLVDLDLTAEDRAFQDEVRAWLEEHLVGEFAEHRGIGGIADDDGWEVRQRWDQELARDGWLAIGWPQEYGGRGATLSQEIIFHLEYARSNAPYRAGGNGQDLLGPMLLLCGSDEQKLRFLPPIASAREYWCQGFSEPNAGSDLANIQTRAKLDGDHWVINGQKIWTSLAHRADFIYVLTRTDPDSARHRGLSMLIVSVDQPGIDVRPIRNISGGAEFAEVFLTDARTPVDMVIGEVNAGWKVAMATLGIERGADLLPHLLTFDREMQSVIELARRRGALSDPWIRVGIADAWIGLQVLHAVTLRTVSSLMHGAAPGAEGSISKLFASEWHQRLGELAMDIAGEQGQVVGPGYELDPFQRIFLDSRSETIYGGSSEIQRNILSERVLGLPREPRPTSTKEPTSA